MEIPDSLVVPDLQTFGYGANLPGQELDVGSPDLSHKFKHFQQNYHEENQTNQMAAECDDRIASSVKTNIALK